MPAPPSPRSPHVKVPTVLVMVGLPARGKTYTARKLARYLNWQGRRARVFNVGNYRRKHLGAAQPAEFFDPDNVRGVNARRKMAITALEDLTSWLQDGGEVAIYDATNSTRARRAMVQDFLSKEGCRVIFVENLCYDSSVIEANIRETKVSSPDYRETAPGHAIEDFRRRIAFYQSAYQSLENDEGSWVKLVDLGRQVLVNEIRGYLPGRLVFFLMNVHTVQRTIYLTRHGESQFNLEHRIGGDSPLSPRGEAYARNLASHFLDSKDPPKRVWTSTLQRTIQTSGGLSLNHQAFKSLDEIDAGVCDGMTYATIQQHMPDEFSARAHDKLRYRYPRGESYEDVIQRLDSIIIELERQQEAVLVIAHQAVLRALYAYFMDFPPEDCPYLDIPLHTVIALRPRAYGCEETRSSLSPSVSSASPSSSGSSGMNGKP